jgi:hypothetical protein
MSGIKHSVLLMAMAFIWSAIVQAEVVPVYQINTTSGNYVQTDLTHDIYRYSANAQLTDLLVLDQQGNKLPYRLNTPKEKTQVKSKQTPVRFFPVPVGASPDTLLILSSASIRLSDNAISVDVQKGANAPVQDQQKPTDFYLVDLSDTATRVDALIVDWPAEQHQYLEVEASGTNDMTNWTPLKKSTLVQLQKEGEHLIRNKVALQLSEKQYAYLRLKFERAENVTINNILIENIETVGNAPAVEEWRVEGHLAKSQESALLAPRHTNQLPVAAWEFLRDDIAPLHSISLSLGDSVYGDNIKVFSRRTDKQPWQLVYQGIWFNAKVGSELQQSDAIPVHHNSDTQWRIEFNEQASASLKPSLVFHRSMQTLQFIANNAAPYSIAIDTQATADHQAIHAQIFSQLITGKDTPWEPAVSEPLNPKLSSFSRHQMAFSWRSVLFWLVLISAVGVLVFVAMRLVGQMRESR